MADATACLRPAQRPQAPDRPRRLHSRSLRLIGARAQARDRDPAVLVAYHGARMRDRLAVLLLRRGYHVTTCADGHEAHQLLLAGPYDLLLTGLVMPNMDGLELLRALWRFQTRPPVIALSETDDRIGQIYMRSALLFGAVAVHAAPIDQDGLMASIDLELEAPFQAPAPVVA